MTLEQAIDRYTNNAEYERTHGSLQGCLDFRQLAEWLKDYKRLLEQQPTTTTNNNEPITVIYPTIVCDDAISREDAEQMFRNIRCHLKPQDYKSAEEFNTRDLMLLNAEQMIHALPSVMHKSGKWIPVSERLPEDLEPVNITWVNHNPESYYADIKDKPFTATGHYCNGRWWWYSVTCQDYLNEYGRCDVDAMDDDIEVIAWQPLPKPYEPQEREEV